jgi:hypothetical protein
MWFSNYEQSGISARYSDNPDKTILEEVGHVRLGCADVAIAEVTLLCRSVVWAALIPP